MIKFIEKWISIVGSSNGRTSPFGGEYRGSSPCPTAILRQGYGVASANHMHYTYILWSSKSKNFYYGSSSDLRKRFIEHNKGLVKSTKPYLPWKLVFYAGFENKNLAEDFERYLKSGSGKAFAYKRLLDVALKKDC